MRIAIISDIHGNLPALESVIRDAEACGAEYFVFAGDYVFDLPWSNEIARLLMKMPNAQVISGNKEQYLLDLSRQDENDWTHEQMGAVYQTFREMPGDVFGYLSALPDMCRVPLSGGRALCAVHRFYGVKNTEKHLAGSSAFHRKMLEKPFTHAQYLDDFTEMINEMPYRQAIEALSADVVVFGHNHQQAHGYCGNTLVINPGSCGQPLDFDSRAAYTILDEDGGFRVTERRAEYDIERAIYDAKMSALYRSGRLWMELVFRAMRTGRDYFGFMFEIANELKARKSETGGLFSDETWRQAYEVYLGRWPNNQTDGK